MDNRKIFLAANLLRLATKKRSIIKIIKQILTIGSRDSNILTQLIYEFVDLNIVTNNPIYANKKPNIPEITVIYCGQ